MGLQQALGLGALCGQQAPAVALVGQGDVEPLGVACPPFDRYVDSLVEYARRRTASRRARPDAIAAEPEADDPLL